MLNNDLPNNMKRHAKYSILIIQKVIHNSDFLKDLKNV